MSAVDYFEQVFDPRFCAFLLANARSELVSGHAFTRSNLDWDAGIRKASAKVLVRDYDATLSAMIIDQLIARTVIDHRDYHVMNYAWTAQSYIPWHNDGHRPEAITLYLNDVWDLDWGGLFLFRDPDDQIRAFPPAFNCGVKNGNHVLHSTTPVSLDAPEPRFTVQLFSTRAS